MGFKVRYEDNNQLEELEAVVKYGGNFHNKVYSTESYDFHIPLLIIWHERKGKNLPIRMSNIISTVESDYVSSGLARCSTFFFGEPEIEDRGTSYLVRMQVWLRAEVSSLGMR